jgi:hypothetical protein
MSDNVSLQSRKTAQVHDSNHIITYIRCFWNRQPYIRYMFHVQCLVSCLTSIVDINTHENNSHLTTVIVVLQWLDCYCYFGVHTVHMQTFQDRCSVYLVLLQFTPPSHLRFSHMFKYAVFYEWLALHAATTCCNSFRLSTAIAYTTLCRCPQT